MKKHLPVTMSFVVFGLSTLFFFYDYFLQVSPGVFAKSLQRSFDVDASGLSLLSACYFLTYTCMQIPAGFLYDKFGGRSVLFCAIIIASLGTFLFGISDNVIWAAVSRLLIGAGSAFAFLGALYYALRWFPHRYFAMLTGTILLVGSIGAMFGDAFLVKLLHKFGWRETMIYISVAGCVLACLIGGFARNHPFDDKIKTKYETAEGVIGEVRALFSNAQVWALGLYGFLNWSIVSVFAVLWGIPYLKRAFSMSLVEASWGISVMWVGIAIGGPVVGWFSDYINRRKSPLIFCSLLASTLFLILLYVSGLSFKILYCLLFMLGFATGGQAVIFGLAKDIMPIQTRNICNGLINMMIVVSGLLLQPLVGITMDAFWQGGTRHGINIYVASTYQSALLILPVAAILSLLIAIFWIKETYCEELPE